MDREDLDGWCERGILAVVLAILVTGPLAFGAVDPPFFLALQGLTILSVVLWITRLWLSERPQILWPPAAWGVVVFVVYALGRYLTAPLEYPARGEFMQILIYALLFLVIVNNLHRQETTQMLVCTLVGLAMVLSFYALFQYVTNSNRVWNVFKPYLHRGSGTYINPNHLGGFLEMVLPLALAFTLASRFKALGRVLLGYCALVIIGGIAVTNSRGTWIAAGFAFIVFFMVLASNRAYRLPAAVLFLVILAGGLLIIPKSRFLILRAEHLVANGRVNDDLRFALWRPAVEIWEEDKWWGAGPAHFDHRFRMHRPDEVQPQPEHAHNDYLEALVDYGIAGIALIGVSVALLAGGAWATWRKVRPAARDIGQKAGSNKFALVLGTSMGLLAILLHSIVDFNMHVPANAVTAVTLMAILSGYARFASDRFWLRLKIPGQVIGSLALLAATALLVFCGQSAAREQRFLAKARSAPLYSATQVDNLSKAFAVEPRNAQTALEIADAYRRRGQEGGRQYDERFAGVEDYTQFTTNALTWFRKAAALDPFDANAVLGQGWCLDWLGQHAEADQYFWKADALDPNGFYTEFRIAQHYMDWARFAAAKPWLERSIRLEGIASSLAAPYLQVVVNRLVEAGTNDFAAEMIRAENGSKPAILNR